MTATRERAQRKNVPLSADDLRVVSELRGPANDKTAALHAMTGIALGTGASEAETIHALIVLGRQVLAAKELELAYAREEEFVAEDAECRAWTRTLRTHLATSLLAEDVAA